MRKRRSISEINVVPYIDVMLVFLIIFMITAPLLTQGVKVELPEAAAEALPADQQEPLIVNVDAGGNLYAINLIRPYAFLACVLLVLRIAGQPIFLPPDRRWASAGVGLLLTAELYAILGAIQFIPVSLAVLINYCYPLLIAVFTWCLGRERATFPKATTMSLR